VEPVDWYYNSRRAGRQPLSGMFRFYLIMVVIAGNLVTKQSRLTITFNLCHKTSGYEAHTGFVDDFGALVIYLRCLLMTTEFRM